MPRNATYTQCVGRKTYRGEPIKAPVERAQRVHLYDLKHFPAGEGIVDLGHGYRGVVTSLESDLRRIMVEGPNRRADTSVRIVRKPTAGGRFLCPWLLCPACSRGVKSLVLSAEMTWHCMRCGRLTWQSRQKNRPRPVAKVEYPKMPSWRYRNLVSRDVGHTVREGAKEFLDSMTAREYEVLHFGRPLDPSADVVKHALPKRYRALLNEGLRRYRSRARRRPGYICPLSPEEEEQLFTEEMRRLDPSWKRRGPKRASAS
jgi:hypothetical protein